MDPATIYDLIVGPVGGFSAALLLVYALLSGKYVSPTRELDASRDRETKLAKEAEILNASLIALTEQNGELKVAVAKLQAEIGYLRDEIERLREPR